MSAHLELKPGTDPFQMRMNYFRRRIFFWIYPAASIADPKISQQAPDIPCLGHRSYTLYRRAFFCYFFLPIDQKGVSA